MSDLDRLQKALGGQVDPTRLSLFQGQHHLAQTGLADPGTLVAAAIYPAPSGQEGSGFFRALAASESQIPQWAWIVGGVGFAAIAGWAWWEQNKRGRR